MRETCLEVPVLRGRPGELDLRALDGRLAGVCQERCDAVGSRTPVGDLHVVVPGLEQRPVQPQRPAGQIELESNLDRLRLLGFKLLQRRLLRGGENGVEVAVPAAALEAFAVTHVRHGLLDPPIADRGGRSEGAELVPIPPHRHLLDRGRRVKELVGE